MHLTDTCCLSERERNEGGVLHSESFRNLENVRNFWSAGNKWKGKKENFPQFLCPRLAILVVSFLRALFLSVSLSLSEPVSTVLPQSGRLPDLPSAWWHHWLPAGLDVLPAFQSVYDRSQMCGQEHTVPKPEINETWLPSKPHIPK